MRAAIWLRVSTDMQVEGDSPATHEKRARSYAEGKAWDVIEVYRLDAVSGKSVIDHPETKRMIADIRRGHVKALIFSKLARLARNTRELLTFSDIFQECGANLISLGESIDTTSPAGRLYFTLIAALTQWEREEIASRVAASVPIRAKLGKKLGGAAPYGLRWQEDRLVADPVEAPVRKHMYELFLKERRIRTVARLLNERGYRTRSGSDWTGTSVERLIKDPTGKGTRIANYTRTTDSKKAWTLKDPKDWVYLPCDPIVTEEVWQEANDILSGRKKTVLKTGRPAVQLFGGLTKCHCGEKMYVRSKSPTKYVCTACTNKIPIADLDALFLSEIASFFVDEEEVTDRMLAIDESIIANEELLSSCLAEQKKLQKEFDLIYKLYLDGQIDQRGFGSKYEPIKARLSSLDEEIPTLQAGLDAAKISRLSRAEVMHEAKDLHSRWPSLDRQERRAIVEAITEEIIVGVDEVTISLLSCSPPKGSHNATREQGFIAPTSWNRAG